jgi:hypothetical protein
MPLHDLCGHVSDTGDVCFDRPVKQFRRRDDGTSVPWTYRLCKRHADGLLMKEPDRYYDVRSLLAARDETAPRPAYGYHEGY